MIDIKRLAIFLIFILLCTIISAIYFNKDNTKIYGKVDTENCDWLSTENFSSTIGTSFVSKIGVTYTIIDMEHNFDSGRDKAVLLSETGEKKMIPNMPAFQMLEGGYTYYKIVDYAYDENYH